MYSNLTVTCSGVICMTWNLIQKIGEALILCPVCLVHNSRLSSPFNKSDLIPFQLYIYLPPDRYGPDCMRACMCTKAIYNTCLYKKMTRHLVENHFNLFPEDIVGQQTIHINLSVSHSGSIVNKFKDLASAFQCQSTTKKEALLLTTGNLGVLSC